MNLYNKVVVVCSLAVFLSGLAAGATCRNPAGEENPDTIHESIVSEVKGSMSGWLDREQLLEVWSNWAEEGELIMETIGGFQTVEGRDLPLIHMGPGVDEAPGAFLNALTHAREIGSIHALTDFIRWLITDKSTDLEAAAVLDRIALTIMPIVNPDGFQLNIDECPDGGGLHRKNMAVDPPGQSCSPNVGVDLNRNFPDHWNGTYSSDICSTDIYRGPSEASEPETQAFMSVAQAASPRTCVSMHTYGNVLIYPYGWQNSDETPPGDFGDAHVQYASEMVKYPPGGPSGNNVLEPGTAYQTLGGAGNGAQDDWLASRDDPCVSFTIELGNEAYGFWPTSGLAGDLALTARYPLTYVSLAAGCLIEYRNVTLTATDISGDGATTFDLLFTPINVGQSDCAAGVLTFSIESRQAENDWETWPEASITLSVPAGVPARTALDQQITQFEIRERTTAAVVSITTPDPDDAYAPFPHHTTLRWETDGDGETLTQGKCYNGYLNGDGDCVCDTDWWGDRCQSSEAPEEPRNFPWPLFLSGLTLVAIGTVVVGVSITRHRRMQKSFEHKEFEDAN